MNPEAANSDFLKDDIQMPIYAPTMFLNDSMFIKKDQATDDDKVSSVVIVFSCWNTMAGSAIVSLPWAFQETGLLLGIIISFTSFLISFYTCYLIIETAKKDKDYIFTLKKYFGKTGYYIGLIGPTILIFGAITVYFVVIVQSAYPLWLVLIDKVFKKDIHFVDPNVSPYYDFKEFSASWIAFIEFFKVLFLSMRRDLAIFVKLGFLGAACVTFMIVFVIIYGVIGLSNTEYEIVPSPSHSESGGKLWVVPGMEKQDILMFNSQFSSLAGILCAGYFIH